MKKIVLTLVVLLLFQGAFSQSKVLKELVSEYESFSAYDTNVFPLGLHTDSIELIKANFAQNLLSKLKTVTVSSLSETELITKELLQFRLQNQVDSYKYGMHLNPLLADAGFHLNLNYRIRPLLNKKNAEQYLKMLKSIPDFTEQHFKLIRQGVAQGISQPSVIFTGYESTYNDHIVSEPSDSPFFQPFKDLPNTFSEIEKKQMQTEAKAIIAQYVIPSFKKIQQFFEKEYLPQTRKNIGVFNTPNGEAFYQNRINYYTTSKAYTADDIHKIGLKEVARIRAEMEKIISDLNFEGSFDDFLVFLRTNEQFYAKTGEELLIRARDIAKRIDAELPKFFKTLPRTPYGVKKVPDAIAPKYTGGRYSGPRSKTEPGYYLVNTYKLSSRPLYVLPSLTAHEAVPGHHLQGSLNRELGDSIPNFRRRTYLSAYGEGWALYTEFLANEFGIYTTPYEEFGKLTYEMWRACRLVVDTGIHAKGWSRQQVVDYMLKNTALSEHEVNTETDRYISWPGQALSYKMGELKIRELRKKAEKELGDNFNIRAFHEVILEQGTVTLPTLERRINAYINNNKSKN
ncbi:hypothetical protein GCM10011414_11610 [Croceivirga lutea]|uniref:DUF885 domain-containing protein n=1 Tax=Croceivirga lutea TaxID=1775167 RepID=UPI00163A68C3|nr:DUF885 domain-containing protein [Croceivirga lutea]GGG43652.1 hypothetical protein GCM10011414_11610 [Croceivirga lutea]